MSSLLKINYSIDVLTKSLLFLHLPKNSIGLSIFSYGTLAKKLFFVWDCTGTNIDDHGSSRGDTAKILARQWHPVALSNALSMSHWATHAALTRGAALVINRDKNNQWNHIFNCVFWVHYSCVDVLHNLALIYQGHMVGCQKGTLVGSHLFWPAQVFIIGVISSWWDTNMLRFKGKWLIC